jgi:flagellar biosynthesis/type III secretory pathway M-ring protein FliF/YscJ
LIPVVGNYIALCLTLALSILEIVFQIRMFQTVHKFSKKKSILILLIPMAVFLLGIILMISMGPSVETVYNGNLDELLLTSTPAP